MTTQNTKQVEVHLLPFLAEAFSLNSKIYKELDIIYNSNRLEIYKASQKSKYIKHSLVYQGSAIQDEYYRITLGIFELIEDYEKEIVNIIRVGWRYEWTYVYNHKSFDFKEFNKAICRKKSIDDMSDDEYNSKIIVAYFLALSYQKKIIESEFKHIIEKGYVDRYNLHQDTLQYSIRYQYKNMNKKEMEIIGKIKLKLFSKFNVKNFRELCEKNLSSKEILEIDEFNSLIYDLEELSHTTIFGNIKFTNKDIEQLLYIYIKVYRIESVEDIQKIDIDDLIKFYVTGVYTKYNVKAYKDFKELYIKNNKDTLLVEIEEIKNKYDTEKSKVDKLENEIGILRKQLLEKEKENKKLKNKLEVVEKNNFEIAALREFMFNQDRKIDYIRNNKEIDLSNIKGLIIGGSDQWQNKMKDLLGSFKFVGVNNINFDIRILEGIDYVFFYTNYLNHGLYYKVIDVIRGKVRNGELKVCYLNGNVNEEIILEEIRDFIG